MIFTLAISLVSAQQDCDQTNFKPCLDLAINYRETTCQPLASKNVTFFNDCLCYNYANEALCYQQCTNNATVQRELRQVQIPKTDNQCKAQGFNYLDLPRPATWEYYFPSNGVKPTVTQSTKGQTDAPNPTGKVSINAALPFDISWAFGLVGLVL